MPYDEAERTWKIRIFGPDDKSEGLVEPGYFQKSHHGEEEFIQFKWFRTWRGKSQSPCTEVLYRQEWQDEDASIRPSYFLLYRHNNDYFTDDDYGRSLTRQRAAEWLIQERYDLPDDLADVDPQNLPLPEAQQEVWDLLENRKMVTLIQFMEDYCQSQTHSLLQSRKKSIQKAHQKGKLTLPELSMPWRRGQSKHYYADKLIKHWIGYCKILPNLPQLDSTKVKKKVANVASSGESETAG